MSAYSAGYLFGMLAVALILGLYVLHYGRKHGQNALGVGGCIACVAGAAFAGLLGAGPVALLFCWLIRREARDAKPWPEAGPERVSH